MKRHLSFSVLLLLSPVVPIYGLQCGKHEYPFQNMKCCHECPQGTEMRERCTENSDTVCQPCEKGSYNNVHTVWNCKSCTICDSANGLWEVEPCKSTSNTVCVCLPGYEPAATKPDEKRCNPCPNGHFSKGGNEACKPWTNCTTEGTKTLLAGTKEKNAVCDNLSVVVPLTTNLTFKQSSKTLTHATSETKPTSTSSTSSALPTESLRSDVNRSEYLPYILITAVLFLVLGVSVPLKIFQKTSKNKGSERSVRQIHTDGKNSFRIPIQEEQIDSKSSLVQI
ncbi:tumor necrosis factor receptor superfamily member 4 [Eublepharis macularius]|uniref:Tumor necrosis factor receptor superfamily member 4 n=1 Tax=Eublepharis macularius TaxID=481883 RepID=A0AA97KKM5_EUBMA|nr:tumor necrosis factor receptor superfamily member 4 [Eublepharis macularius]